MGVTFVNQSAYAKHRKVSRKSVTLWKHRGLLVIRDSDGLVDRDASDARLEAHGLDDKAVTRSRKSLPRNKVVTDAEVVTGLASPAAEFASSAILAEMDDPSYAGAMAMGLSIAYSIGPTVAAMAVQAGASCEVAYSLERALRFAVIQHINDQALAVGFRPFRDGAEPQYIDCDAFAETNWPRLAKIAGKSVNLAAWHEHHMSKFAKNL